MATKALSLLLGVLITLSLCSLVITVRADSGAGIWRIANLDSGSEFDNSIALDANGYAHISYLESAPNYTLKYAYQDAGGWHLTTVDFANPDTGQVWGGTSLALDTNGYPHISYVDWNESLKYAYQDAGGWHFQLVDESHGWSPSIALDAYGFPRISYTHSDGTLKYAYQDGGGWHYATIGKGYSSGHGSLALDANGFPHISYGCVTGIEPTTTVLKYAYQDASGWHNMTLDNLDNACYMASCSIALDAKGYSHVSYDYTNMMTPEPSAGALRYAYQDAGGWHLTTVNDAGEASSVTSLALDALGSPHISYQNATDGTLKYAYQDPAGWQVTTVDNSGRIGYYNSLALAANGFPRISYQRWTAIAEEDVSSLMYASWTLPTQLSASTTPTTVGINQLFMVRGTLNTASSVPVASATVQLQENVSGTWTDVAGKTNTTTTTGAYSISTSEPLAGTYQYRTTFAGDDTYANATSSSVSVNVVAPPVSVGAPAVSAQNASGLDLFVRNTTGTTWWEELNGGKVVVPWTSLGGVGTADPAATSPANGAINVFVRGTDNALWEKTTTNGGSSWSWTSLGGQLASGTGPAACSVSGRMDVFVQGTDGALWHRSYTSTWSGWQSLGGKLTSSPAAARAQGSNRIDVAGRGTDGVPWSRTSTNGGASWNSWTSLGGKIAQGTGPAMSSWSSSRVDLFVQGTDGVLWHRPYTGTWASWESLGSPVSKPLTSSPAAVSPGSNVIDVATRGGDNGLWQKAYISGWSGWTSLAI